MSAAVRFGLKEKIVLSLCRSKMMAWAGLNPTLLFPGTYTKTNKKFTVNYFGHRYDGEIDSLANWMIYYFGDPDICVTAFVHELVSFIKYNTARSFCCYDLSANRGEFSLKVAGIVDSVVAVERSERQYAQLVENVGFSGLTNIKTFNVHLGIDDDGAARSAPSAKKSDVTSLPHIILDRSDAFIETNRLQPPDLVRINAGSDPLSILRWLQPVLAYAEPAILIERATSAETSDLCEIALKSAFHQSAKIYSLQGSPRERAFKLERFVPHAHRIVCFPHRISRMFEQDLLKMRGIRAL